MRVTLLRFGGYPAGETDFFNYGAANPSNPTLQLADTCQTIAKGIAGIENVRSTITIVGHSDRQDRSDFNCDQRRASEIEAARDRANSAWEFIKPTIAQYLDWNGWESGDWWEVSDRVTWDLVYAASGMLLTGSGNENERAQNRRVDFLISIFNV